LFDNYPQNYPQALGSVHNSSRGNLLTQKRACRVENARKVANLAALFALHLHLQKQNPPHKRIVRTP
jgi:hypothetical protein